MQAEAWRPGTELMPRREKPSSAAPNVFGGLMLSLLSILVTFLVAEGLLRWWSLKELSVHGIAELIFLSEGRNFRVHDWGGFTHNPNSLITVRSFHITNLRPLELVQEYDYDIRTNSYGLVQIRDISANTPA